MSTSESVESPEEPSLWVGIVVISAMLLTTLVLCSLATVAWMRESETGHYAGSIGAASQSSAGSTGTGGSRQGSSWSLPASLVDPGSRPSSPGSQQFSGAGTWSAAMVSGFVPANPAGPSDGGGDASPVEEPEAAAESSDASSPPESESSDASEPSDVSLSPETEDRIASSVVEKLMEQAAEEPTPEPTPTSEPTPVVVQVSDGGGEPTEFEESFAYAVLVGLGLLLLIGGAHLVSSWASPKRGS